MAANNLLATGTIPNTCIHCNTDFNHLTISSQKDKNSEKHSQLIGRDLEVDQTHQMRGPRKRTEEDTVSLEEVSQMQTHPTFLF